ncbi:MAG: hypothetical protein GY862_27985 [Gammaproteobacteria bacterium]|nr:hypothetical protein [Gammaproteobacteria bacterium]
MKSFQIINEDGRPFFIRLIRKNEHHGEEDKLIYREDEPLLEFFDADNQEEGDGLGYFTGLRCTIGTLFKTAFETGGAADILFNQDLPMWNISHQHITAIQEWVLQQLDPGEVSFINKNNSLAVPVACGTKETCQTPPQEKQTGRANREHDAPAGSTPLRQQLASIIEALDTAEISEKNWRNGDVKIRLQILAAKKNVLKAFALLNEPDPRGNKSLF